MSTTLLNSLFFLPIHRRTYKKYYQDYNKLVIPKKKEVEKQWNKKFEKLSLETQYRYEETWFWPPWKFNDTIGFLNIGTDGWNYLTANIYLKRKYFPRSARERRSRRYHSTLKNQEFLYYGEITKIKINTKDNDSFIKGTNKLLEEAEKIIQNLNKNFKLWFPSFDFPSCFNFAKAYKQIKSQKQNDKNNIS